MEILLQPFGDTGHAIIAELKACLVKAFGCPIGINDPIAVPQEAFNPDRKQYLSDILLDKLRALPHINGKLLGVTEVDLFTEGLNFVFGQADSAAGVAIISLCLLRQEHYGLPADTQLLIDRALKEAVHELGHTFGMGHCPDGTCVMHFSNSLFDTDYKKNYFCNNCRPKLLL